jgi:excisionase family DNA binding protein
VPAYLKVAEVAEMLRITRQTVRNLAARGELPGIKAGKSWRFRWEDLEQHLRSAVKKD